MTPSATYAVTTEKSVESAIEAVTDALNRRQFSVLWHLDMNEKLVQKGLEPEPPFHVLEVCSAPRAKEALRVTQTVGYFLPCKLVVYVDRQTGKTTLGLPDPVALLNLAGHPTLDGLAREVTAILHEAVEEAAQ